MRFPINTILYSKGWYARRGDVDVMWMDMIHTINCDGWLVNTKSDVAGWCLRRFDEFKKEIWKNNDRYCTSMFFYDMKRKSDYWYMWSKKNVEELSQDDLIIWVFFDYMNELSRDEVIGWMKPSEQVLPLRRFSQRIFSDGDKWEPAEMHCDVIKRINDMFEDAPEQKLDMCYSDFNTIESSIRNGNPKNVVVDLSSFSFRDCIKVEILGEQLGQQPHLKNSIYLPCINGEESYIDLGVYSYCEFDKDKKYSCYIEVKKDVYFNAYTLVYIDNI